MLKSKICFTVFVLYEIIAVMLLHCTHTCFAMFGGTFCSDSVYKYFLICAAVPMLAIVLGMWVHEIFFARRRSFFHRARDIVDDVAIGIKNHLGRAFDAQDMDKYLAAAILFGIKKYSARHPQMRQTIHDIISGADIDAYEYPTDDITPTARRATRPASKSGAKAASRRTSTTTRRASR